MGSSLPTKSPRIMQIDFKSVKRFFERGSRSTCAYNAMAQDDGLEITMPKSIILCLFGGAVIASWNAFLFTCQDSPKRPPTLPQWRPNRPPSGVRYLGDAACAQCHRSEAARQEA